MPRRLVPHLVTALQGYTRRDFAADRSSGVIAREFTENVAERDPNSAHTRHVPRGVVAETFKDTLARTMGTPRVLVLRMRNVPAIDATGMHALMDVIRRTRRDRTLVLLSDVHAQPLIALGRAGVIDAIGDDNIFVNIDDALNRARRALGLPEEPPPPSALPTVAREQRASQAAGIPSAVHPDLLGEEEPKAAERG